MKPHYCKNYTEDPFLSLNEKCAEQCASCKAIKETDAKEVEPLRLAAVKSWDEHRKKYSSDLNNNEVDEIAVEQFISGARYYQKLMEKSNGFP